MIVLNPRTYEITENTINIENGVTLHGAFNSKSKVYKHPRGYYVRTRVNRCKTVVQLFTENGATL